VKQNVPRTDWDCNSQPHEEDAFLSSSSVSFRRKGGFAKHGAGRSMDGLEQDAPATMKMWARCPLSLKYTGGPPMPLFEEAGSSFTPRTSDFFFSSPNNE
jgi:hypothetical protein